MRKPVFVLFFLGFLFGNAQNQQLIDSLQKILPAKEDTNRCKILLKLATQYSKSDTRTAVDYSHQGLELARRLGNEKLMNDAYYKLGMYLRYQADFQNAIAYLDSSLVLTKKDKDEKGIAQIYNAYGNVYHEMDNYTKAISYFLESIKIKERLNLTGSLANSYVNLGNVYNRVNLFEKAQEYFRKGYDLKRKEGDFYGMAGAANSLAVLLNRNKKYNEAISIFNETFKLAEKNSDAQLMAALYGNLAESHLGLNNNKKAEELTLKSLSYREELGDYHGMAYCFSSLAEIYLNDKKFKKSIDAAENCLTYSRKSDYLEGSYYAHLNLSKAWAALGDYPKAYNYLTESNLDWDSLNVLESQQIISETESKYQVEKKEGLAKLANEKVKSLAAEVQKQNQQKLFMAVAIGLFALLALFIFNGYRQKKKSNEIITLQNAEVNEQKSIIEEKQKEILDSIIYAKRLQEAILPPEELIKKYFPESFILYLPKDIVAGDFYWFEVVNSINHRDTETRSLTGDKAKLGSASNLEHDTSTILIASCDCTGHGVPGAIVSIVCSNALNSAVKEFHLKDPGKILDKVRELVLETFEKSDKDVKDGMDISLLSIERKYEVRSRMLSGTEYEDGGKLKNKVRGTKSEDETETEETVRALNKGSSTAHAKHQTSNADDREAISASRPKRRDIEPQTIQWAGANNPLWYIDGEKFTDITAHKQPIGKTDYPTNFPTHTIEFTNRGWCYLFTDGYADQFGGPKGKKFKYKNLQNLLVANNTKDPKEQHAELLAAFKNWKGSLEQIDDVCIIGLRV